MAKKKVEVFLEESEINLLKKISNNRSEAIRICVKNNLKKIK